MNAIRDKMRALFGKEPEYVLQHVKGRHVEREIVQAIRAESGLSQRAIGKKYNVAQSAVSDIRSFKTHKYDV